MNKKVGILERAERYEKTLAELGERLLRSSDLENRLEGLKQLARRQRANCRHFWWRRGSDSSYYLNKRDYFDTKAKIVELYKDIFQTAADVDVQIGEVKDCLVTKENRLWADATGEEDPDDDWPESDEVLAGGEESATDPFEGTDQPVDLGGSEVTQPNTDGVVDSGKSEPTQPFPPVEAAAEAPADKPAADNFDDAS